MKKLSTIVAMVLAAALSITSALAVVYESNGEIVLPGGRIFAHNEVNNNKKDAYASTSGPANEYLSVSGTFYYIVVSTGATSSYYQSGSTSSLPSIRKDAPTLPTGSNYYKVKSVHTGTISDDSGSITLTTIP